ncbi:hypothetical protein Syun_026066 [Stephania yunnanensis]|uniref:Uncharacterized protein n=1 Tax=Stephania yunnanensis TaxID=152371 RepID=A0AAP0ESU0_9MAGN
MLVHYNSQHRQILSISTIRGLTVEAMARDNVRVPVKCRDRDRGLVRHRDKTETSCSIRIEISTYLCRSVDSQVTSPVRVHNSELAQQSQEQDVALTYINGRRQMVCSLLGGHGGAQLITEEPSPTE